MLDELGMTGEVVWIGAGALGASDGRVVLLPRAHAARLGALSPAAYAPPTPQHAAVIACLEQRGACFLAELDARVGNAPERLVSVLLDLAWAGVVTNDTLQPLRVLPSWNKKGRGTMPPAKTSLGGRWALTRSLGDPLSDTAVALARSHALLQRYGVVSAPMAHAAGFAGGFAAVYPVLRSLEDVGKVRRGSFVADLDGAQFATPVAIEVLRAVRPDDAEALVLSVLDPANPWGSLFAWPPTARPGAPEPRRVAGAQLIVVGGKPCVYVDPSGKNLATFADLAEVERERAFQALPRVAERLRGPAHWSVERVDGEPALREPYAGWLQAVGFALTWRGLAMDAPLRSAR
jgi:ATP-dependent Lhr-like helicase